MCDWRPSMICVVGVCRSILRQREIAFAMYIWFHVEWQTAVSFVSANINSRSRHLRSLNDGDETMKPSFANRTTKSPSDISEQLIKSINNSDHAPTPPPPNLPPCLHGIRPLSTWHCAKNVVTSASPPDQQHPLQQSHPEQGHANTLYDEWRARSEWDGGTTNYCYGRCGWGVLSHLCD